jgi:O-antigen ligase
LAARPVEAARWLLAGVLLALLVSPPLTSLLELSLYALMLGSAPLRARLSRALREPLVAAALGFWVLAALGLAYSPAPWQESFGIWFSWRRLLLLVLAAALFDEAAWKRQLTLVLVAVTAGFALVSYAGAFLAVPMRDDEIGVVVRNHSMQGMIFAVAAFAAAALVRYDASLTAWQRRLLGAAALLLVLNVVFVTPGRSGYVVLLALCGALALAWIREAGGRRITRAALGGGAMAVVVGVLAASPLVQQRMSQGIQEALTYREAVPSAGTSAMGLRMAYWKNTLELVCERPWLGYGTGSFETAYGRLVAGRPGLLGVPVHDPHNQFMKITAEHGLLGLAAFLLVLALALARRASSPYRLLGLGVLVAWCLTSLFSSHFSTFSEGRFVWLWLGACLAQEGGSRG